MLSTFPIFLRKIVLRQKKVLCKGKRNEKEIKSKRRNSGKGETAMPLSPFEVLVLRIHTYKTEL